MSSQCTCSDAVCIYHIRERILKPKIDYHKQAIVKAVEENKLSSVKFNLSEWEKLSDLYYSLKYLEEE